MATPATSSDAWLTCPKVFGIFFGVVSISATLISEFATLNIRICLARKR